MVSDIPIMTAVWTTVLICQVNGCASHDGSMDPSPRMPSPGTTILVRPSQGTTVPSRQKSVMSKCDMSDEDRLRNVVLNDYGMATRRGLIGSNQVL